MVSSIMDLLHSGLSYAFKPRAASTPCDLLSLEELVKAAYTMYSLVNALTRVA